MVAAAQRVLDQVEQKILSAEAVQQTLNLVDQVAETRAQIQQTRDAAEGLIGRVTGWGAMLANTAGMLGSPGEVSTWLSAAQDLSARAQRIQAGTEAAAPTPAEARALWDRLPDFPSLGGPPRPPPAVSRAEAAERRQQALADRTGRLDALLARRAEALERNATALEAAKTALDQVKANTETSVTALAQKQQAIAGATGDLLAAREQREALLEERELTELAEQRASFADLQTQTNVAVGRLFTEAADLMARFDADAADQALTRAVLPAYGRPE